MTRSTNEALAVPDEGTASAARSARATRAILLVGIPLFWSALYIYNSYLSVYAESLNPSLSLVGVVVAAYGFTQLVLRIPIGIASDRLGRRKPFVMAGGLVGALSCAAFLIAAEPWVLVLGRGLAGVAAAFWVPLTVLLVATYPRDRVVHATSMATALSAIGMTISSAAGGQIAQSLGLRAPFWVGIVLGLLTVVLIAVVREPRVTARTPTTIAALLSVGRIRLVLVVSVLALLNQYVSWAMTHAFVPIHGKNLGADTAALGVLMSLWQGSYALVSFSAGIVESRLGTRVTAALGLAVTAASTVAIPFVGTLGMLGTLRALHGAGVGLVAPVLMAGAVTAVPAERRGAAMGFYQSIYAIGMVAGPALSGVFADHLGLASTFYVSGGISLLAMLGALVALPHRARALA